MTSPRNTPDGPVHLGEPLTEPEPAPGCKDCQRWGQERETAQAAGDAARVSDCNVQIRRHPHPAIPPSPVRRRPRR